MRCAVKWVSNRFRIACRFNPDRRLTALTALVSSSTMKPVKPSSMISGTEPRLYAITGVPQAIASIMTRPNGSGQSIGTSSPIDWPEPFGLVMIEAMACGTPVIAYNRGSVPEIIDEGLTGFIVEDETSAVSAVKRLSGLNRHAIRKRFETHFTAHRMALDYLAVYRGLMEAGEPRIKLVSSAE